MEKTIWVIVYKNIRGKSKIAGVDVGDEILPHARYTERDAVRWCKLENRGRNDSDIVYSYRKATVEM